MLWGLALVACAAVVVDEPAAPPAAVEAPPDQRPAPDPAEVEPAPRVPAPSTAEQPRPSVDIDWQTALWAGGGCTLCGLIPFGVAFGTVGLAAFLVAAGLSSGGCGGAVAVIVGVFLAIAGLVPSAGGGVVAPIGAAGGTAWSRYSQNRSMLWPSLATLVGVVPGLLAAAATVGGFGVLVAASEESLPEWALAGVAAGAVAIFFVALLSGPLAVAAGTGAAWVGDALSASIAQPASAPPVAWAPPVAGAPSSGRPLRY